MWLRRAEAGAILNMISPQYGRAAPPCRSSPEFFLSTCVACSLEHSATAGALELSLILRLLGKILSRGASFVVADYIALISMNQTPKAGTDAINTVSSAVESGQKLGFKTGVMSTGKVVRN